MDENNLFHTLPIGAKAPDEINVIIEISEGSRVKYEFNKQYGCIFVDRFLHTPIPYPFSYGLIPHTWNDFDHDPLDAILIASEPVHPGCVVTGRVIGILRVNDSGERDDKILCVPNGDPYFADVKSINDLTPKKREDIEYFLCHYKDLEVGKTVEVSSWDDRDDAKKFILECIDCYNKKFA